MTKKMPTLLIGLFTFMLIAVSPTFAQTATESATNSATTTSTATTSTTTSTATTLPATGAHDVLIIFATGMIFLFAGITVFSGLSHVFNDLE
jgi:hypothetical protein